MMKMSSFALSKVVAALILAIFATASVAQEKTPEQKSIDIQNARAPRVKKRGESVYYTTKFDLSDLPQYSPEQKISGTIHVWGLNYLTDGNLGKYWADEFRKFQPDAKIDYYTPTALVAIPGLYTGKADIGASRHITFDELLTYQRIFNRDPVEIEVVTGSLNVPGWAPGDVIFVNKENPISKLTLKQLDGIFGAERDGGWKGTAWDPTAARGPEKNIRTWGQVGLTGEWKDKPIHVYGRPLRYHQQLHFERVVMQGSDKWNEALKEYAHDETDNGVMKVSIEWMLEDLAKDKYGIAFAYFGYPSEKNVKALALGEADKGPFIPPTLETFHDRTYPLYSAEFFYVNREPGKTIDPKVREFLRYILSREGQEQVMRDGKFLPLTGAVVREQLRKIQ
ncbi:MAG: PstS family phosphate ABC transporter substrate-binding protein [Terriglobales bacterium]